MKVFGVTGLKNAGKTGLMERLVTEISHRGYAVSTIKRTHHNVDLDVPGTDSVRHRAAGAQEVMLASDQRFALMREHQNPTPPRLADLIARLAPVDLVLVEGFKSETHPKIECFRASTQHRLLSPENSSIVAVAADAAVVSDLPQFDLNDTQAIATFVIAHCKLKDC
ncbi:MAG: molybdopterin-guanine dinucleotide biosynthesis protein B [Cognatishimia sp.]